MLEEFFLLILTLIFSSILILFLFGDFKGKVKVSILYL